MGTSTRNLGGSDSKVRRNLIVRTSKETRMGANYEMLMTRSDGETFFFEALTRHLIYRFDFYQSGQFRLEKSKIIDFFNLQQ